MAAPYSTFSAYNKPTIGNSTTIIIRLIDIEFFNITIYHGEKYVL